MEDAAAWHNSPMDITDWRTSSFSYNGNSCLEAGSFRTSTFSVGGGACVECAGWRKSSRCAGNGSCTEITSCGHGVAIRDSTDRSGPVLTFGAGEWEQFAGRIKADAGVTR